MEGLSVFLIFVVYIGIRLLLGHHKDQTFRDTQKFREGIELVERHQYEEAFQYFNEVLAENPKSGVAWAYRCICHYQFENYYQALADATKAINIDYKLRDAYFIRGLCLYELENFQGAAIEFGKTLWHYRDKHPESFRYRALCYYELQNFQKSREDLEKAVRLGDEDANYFLIKIQKRQDVI